MPVASAKAKDEEIEYEDEGTGTGAKKVKEAPFNPNSMRDLIECCIETSRSSKIPFLLLGNPGISKSTCIAKWAERNGYYLEVLVGSRHSQEEILGYMVKVNDGDIDSNLITQRVEYLKSFCPKSLTEEELTKIALTTMNNDRLSTLTPDWFNRVDEKAKAGTPSVLFLDEVSGCPENVQASLLTLIFDRTVGNGTKLPDNCIVMAAANYKGNLGGVFNIIPPALNRFVIMNMEFKSVENLIQEFLRDPKTWDEELIAFQNNTVTKEIEDFTRAGIQDMMRRLFNNYANTTGENSGILDLKNQRFDEMYDNSNKPVYNFISGRTVSYLARIACAIYNLGIGRKVREDFVDGCVLGLIGLGTNTFTNEKQGEEYRKSAKKLFHKITKELNNRLKSGGSKTSPTRTLNFTGKTVYDAIHEWTLYNETVSGIDKDDNIILLYHHIAKTYNSTVPNMVSLIEKYEADSNKEPEDQEGLLKQFANDMSRIDGLIEELNACKATNIDNIKHNLNVIQTGWDYYKKQAKAALISGKTRKVAK
jgi:MoxR-like ATPase